MFKSNDGGLTWAPLTATAVGSAQSFTTLYQSGWRVITSPADTGAVVYMATIGTIYRSANGGRSWMPVLGGDINNYSYFADVAASPTGVLYATMSSDGPGKASGAVSTVRTGPIFRPIRWPVLHRSTTAWCSASIRTTKTRYISSVPRRVMGTTIITSIRTTGAACGSTPTPVAMVPVPAARWENLSGNLPNKGTEFDRFAGQGGYDLVVRVQPGSGNVFVGGANLYRSTDAFTSDSNTTQLGGYAIGTTLPFFQIYPGHHPDQHDLLFLPSDPNILLSACDGGLFRTNDSHAPSVNWTTLNRGYQTTQFYTAIIDKHTPNDPMLLGGLQDNGNFFVNSNDPTAPWKQTVNGDGSFWRRGAWQSLLCTVHSAGTGRQSNPRRRWRGAGFRPLIPLAARRMTICSSIRWPSIPATPTYCTCRPATACTGKTTGQYRSYRRVG